MNESVQSWTHLIFITVDWCKFLLDEGKTLSPMWISNEIDCLSDQLKSSLMFDIQHNGIFCLASIPINYAWNLNEQLWLVFCMSDERTTRLSCELDVIDDLETDGIDGWDEMRLRSRRRCRMINWDIRTRGRKWRRYHLRFLIHVSGGSTVSFLLLVCRSFQLHCATSLHQLGHLIPF